MTQPARLPLRVPTQAAAPAQPAVAAQAYGAPAQASSRAPVSAASIYGGIEEAKTDTRYPWFQREGRYLVQTLGWRGQKNFSGKFADVWDVEILHTYRGEHQAGEKLTRMRVQNQWNNHLDEVKTRAVTLLTIVNFDEQGQFQGAVHPSQVTVDTLVAITEGNGAMFEGAPVIVEVMPEKSNTRGPGTFTPFNYAVPTARDLAEAGLQQG